MTVTIIVAVICLIAGGVASYLFFRYGLKNKYNTILKEAEAEGDKKTRKNLLRFL